MEIAAAQVAAEQAQGERRTTTLPATLAIDPARPRTAPRPARAPTNWPRVNRARATARCCEPPQQGQHLGREDQEGAGEQRHQCQDAEIWTRWALDIVGTAFVRPRQGSRSGLLLELDPPNGHAAPGVGSGAQAQSRCATACRQDPASIARRRMSITPELPAPDGGCVLATGSRVPPPAPGSCRRHTQRLEGPPSTAIARASLGTFAPAYRVAPGARCQGCRPEGVETQHGQRFLSRQSRRNPASRPPRRGPWPIGDRTLRQRPRRLRSAWPARWPPPARTRPPPTG